MLMLKIIIGMTIYLIGGAISIHLESNLAFTLGWMFGASYILIDDIVRLYKERS